MNRSCSVTLALLVAGLPSFAPTALAQTTAPAPAASTPLFDVIAPDQVAFNYPQPPREGKRDYFTIAEQGQARCVVVYGAEAPAGVRTIAARLASYLQLVTGGQFKPISDTTPVPEGMAAIHVGETSATAGTPLNLPKLQYGENTLPNVHGYEIRTLNPQTLVIRGPNEQAVKYGVVGLLTRYLGVRQFWQDRVGGLGEEVPSRPTLRLPELLWQDWPYFVSRTMSTHAMLNTGGVSVDFFRRGGSLPASENYYKLLPAAKYAATHPEYYPLIAGQRKVPAGISLNSRWQPCVSNPEVAQIMAREVIEHFRRNPHDLGFNVSHNDGYGDCECEKCRAMDAPNADYGMRRGMSDRYVKFTNQVAEIVAREFPDKAIVYLGYSATQHPPETVALHPNIVPVFTVNHPFQAWDNWLKTNARHLGMYIHHNGALGFVLPRLDVQQMGRRIRYMVASGRARVFYMEMHQHWPSSGPVAYVTCQLLWDPRQNVDELLNEYYSGMFGPAAPAMQEFHAAIEGGYERYREEAGGPHWYSKELTDTHGGRQEQFRLLNEAEADRAAAALARALATPGLQERHQQRLQLVQAQFRMQELCARRYWASVRLASEPVHSEADARRVVADARQVVALSQAIGEHVRDVLEQPPLDAYKMFQRIRPGNAVTYASLKSGVPGPELVTSINVGIRSATEYLRESQSPERAAAWWSEVQATERSPVLAGVFTAAEARALGVELKNLLEDPGYEIVGEQFKPDDRDLDADRVLTPAQVKSLANMHIWFADRSPYRVSLTAQDPHSGNYCLQMQQLARARLSRGVPAEPEARYRVGLWVKRNAGPGRYRVVIGASMPGGGVPKSLAEIPVPEQPDQWHEITADVVTPPDARRVVIQLFIDRQGEESAVWVDDFFIGKYPQ